MKKYILSIILSAVCLLYPNRIRADYSLEQLRIANTLINEAGGLGEKSMTYVAEVIRNQYNEQRADTKNKDRDSITYSDILYHTWVPGKDSNFSGSRDKFASKTKEQLEKMGRERMKGSTDWQTALDLAGKLINGTLNTNYVGGANAFHGCKYSTIEECQRTEPKHKLTHLSVTPAGFKNQVFYHWDLGAFHHKYESDVVAEPSPTFSPSASQDPTMSEDGKLEQEALACTMESMQQIYLQEDENGESAADKYCWYCKIVVVLVNAYLKVARDAMDKATIPLGKIILEFGFLVWLAYYILQQVSSLNPITPGKMLQEILVMMFKVALAYAAIEAGPKLISDYYLNPIVGTGIDYGMNIFEAMGSS